MLENVILLMGKAADELELGAVANYLDTKYQLKGELLRFSEYGVLLKDRLYLLLLSDDEIKTLFQMPHVDSIEIGILPHVLCPIAMQSYAISSDLYEAIDAVFSASNATAVDLLQCNGLAVLDNVIIGNVHGMNRSPDSSLSWTRRVTDFFSSIFHLTFGTYTFTTAKGYTISTAATGIMIFEHNISGKSRNLLRENLSHNDGRLHAMILAPSSVVSYLSYLFFSYFLSRLFMERLPRSIGFIASSKLEISSARAIEYNVDGKVYSDKQLSLSVIPDALHIYLGCQISEPEDKKLPEEEKESIRVSGLPRAEMSALLMSEALPFLPRAHEEDFKELFVSLRQSAKLSSVFIVLMLLSSLLSTTGLFQNSTPVIIGAMILAPLMAPIISFSMGVLRGEKEFMRESATTLFVGVMTALLSSCIYSAFLPLNVLTQEMQSRLNPNILDLMVAIIAGIAGAYAYAKVEVAKSLAGVAIAVALVPPLSVTGVGIAWWDAEIVYGSFLLFLTNLAGITLAASLTFLILGFSPIRRATKGILVSMLFLSLITIPLFFSFFKVVEQNRIFVQLKAVKHIRLAGHTVGMRTLSVDLSKEIPVVYVEIRSERMLNDDELQELKVQIDAILHQPVALNILSDIELRP